MNIQPVPHIPEAEAQELAMEIVSVATNLDFGDLRTEMVSEVLTREFPDLMVTDPKQAALKLVLLVKLLAGALEVFADNMTGTVEL